MQATIAQNKFAKSLPFLFLSGWSLLLLANFIPSIPQPAVIIGYLWKVEFALAAFLFIALVFFIRVAKDKTAGFGRQETFWIILPLVLFTAWSGFSCFWAESLREAIHHTLLWACYCVFYFLIRRLVSQPRFLGLSFKLTALAVFILGAACITEYVSNIDHINSVFTYRYYKYAEAALMLLPIFLALALKSKSKKAVIFGIVAVIAWLMVLLCLSRTLFIAGFVCVALFFTLVFLSQDRRKYLKRSFALIGVFAVCFLISQISLSTTSTTTVTARFSTENSQSSFKSRFLYWGIALEAFKQNPVIGVGADNFVSVYLIAREKYSTADPQNKLLELDEDNLAERAHNEYLQILSELGAVGAALFVWLLGGIALIFLSLRKKRVSLLSIASFAGICAFLISSVASSYSFRVPANGLCFFFLLALAAKSLKSQVPSPKLNLFSDLRLGTLDLRLVSGLLICAATLIFSAVRGTSLMYLQFAQTSEEETQKERYFQDAIALDGRDGSIRYYYGSELYRQKRVDEAIPQIHFAIDRGIATSIVYFDLASAQCIAGKLSDAEKTFTEAIKVYPRSVFLRTSYAAFLAKNGEEARSEIEYAKAFEINPRQANSWRIAHTEGMQKLSEAENRDKDLVEVMDLRPTEAIYALLDFQRQFNPNLVRR